MVAAHAGPLERAVDQSDDGSSPRLGGADLRWNDTSRPTYSTHSRRSVVARLAHLGQTLPARLPRFTLTASGVRANHIASWFTTRWNHPVLAGRGALAHLSWVVERFLWPSLPSCLVSLPQRLAD